MGGYAKNTPEMALAKVLAGAIRTETGCLETLVTPTSTYPMVKIDGKFVKAGRLVYEMHHGVTIPPDRFACHTCDNTRCVEWSHIYIGTPKQNSQDRELRGRSTPQWGAHHWTAREPDSVPKGVDHHNARLTPDDIREIRRLGAAGVDQTEISRQFGVSRGYVSLVITRRRWKHLP